MINESSKTKDNVVLVWKDPHTGQVQRVKEIHNIVTNAGDKYYAQRAAAETASLTFNRLSVGATLATNAKTATFGDIGSANIPTGGTQTIDSGYPQTNDSDTDNTGSDSDVVTWRASFGTASGNTNIKAIMIHQNGAVTGSLLLNIASLTVSEPKTASSTLKVFVNHTFLGV